ncbi:homoserine O-succinyltransferase [Oscillospiraceae bacterium HV4-5-C5C]|nr:homoserine O-succinyltransferase [Oscillospiraceae bacterium HV4-5-C5C]
MPIIIPSDIPAAQTLGQEGVFYMDEARSFHQDIRPLRILIVNLMPNKINTETQLFRLLGNTSLQIEPYLLYTESYQPRHTARQHLARFYNTFSEVEEYYFDGMIITGAPVEQMPFEKVTYWDELCRIMNWSKTHVYSTLHICWGAQAGLYYHYGVPKYELSKKMFGVFEHRLNGRWPSKLFWGFDDAFFVPHSRYTENREADILRQPELRILSKSRQSGVFAVADRKGRQIFITGHVEYDPLTLKQEYERDLARGLPIDLPVNYYPEDDPAKPPLVRWRSVANILFSNWLNYFVYQVTPFQVEHISALDSPSGRNPA